MLPIAALALAAVPAVPAPVVTVGLDAATGALSRLAFDGADRVVRPAQEIGIQWDGGALPPRDQWRTVRARSAAGRCEAILEAGPWRIALTSVASGATVRRRAKLRWLGPGDARVRGTWLGTPVLRLSGSPNDEYLVPGNFPVTRRRFDALRAGAETREVGWTRGDYAAIVLRSPATAAALLAGYAFEMDQARVSAHEEADGVTIRHSFDTAALLQPGGTLTVGTQVIRAARGDERQVMTAFASLSGSLGNGPPRDRPAEADRCALYEAHPWGRLETWSQGDRGNRYPRLGALMPYYRSLGITTLWLLPVSWPPPWVYTLPAFDRIAPENGTAAELKALVDSAHAHDMRMLVDLVTYGVLPSSEEVKRLPDDAWCYDEQGKRQIVWGGAVLAADCANAAWQRRIGEVAAHWSRDFGFDGTRLDVVGWGQALNWRNPLRANASLAFGGLQLNKVVRDAMRRHNPAAFTLPEGGKPLVLRNADMIFDYPLYMAMRDMTTTPDLNLWIARAREWLEWERHAYPRSGLTGLVRFLENHDTVSAPEFFGVGPSQALMAICCLIQGTPLAYQEQEIGFSRDLAAWLGLRARERCFRSGEADYLAVRCDVPGLFCFLRVAPDGAAVVAVNLTGRATDAHLQWPGPLAARFPAVVDGLEGRTVASSSGSATVRVEPYRPRVLLLKRRAPKAPPTGPTAVSHRETIAALPAAPGSAARVEAPWQATSWFVETSEGRLEDAFHTYETKLRPGESLVDALPVLRRAWDPLPGGLLDGGDRAVVGLRSVDGREMAVTIDARRARDVRIVNPAGDGRAAAILVGPREALLPDGAAPGLADPRMQVTPQFVRLRGGGTTLTLARRHGGVPVELALNGAAAPLVQPGGDLYSDYGLWPERRFASADGDTNPRLDVGRDGETVTATFRGVLRERSWNGVQTCGTPGPPVAYRLTYALDAAGRLRVTLGLTPSTAHPAAAAFLALRLPLLGTTGWRRGDNSGEAGARPGERQAAAPGGGTEPLLVRFGDAALRVRPTGALQNLFLIDESPGRAQLFLALLDGQTVDLPAGEERTAEVTIESTTP